MNAIYLGKDQNWTDESTTYWFDRSGAEYGVVESGGEAYIVDSNGLHLDQGGSFAALIAAECVVTDEMRND